MVPEHLLVAIVQPRWRFALPIGAGISPSIDHFAGLVIDDIELAEVPRI
jgi:hypothetical protein